MVNKITGYRELTPAEIDLINEVKDLGELVNQFVTREQDFNNTDKRWLAIAKTDLQKGFMALVRSIAKPEGF